ncbi:uncharacterized protein LOC128952188 [Oppia nitens]|uniref:uncharacterized protein LOC128952188 n=1 Tax=Oppia nitens TaxID=1686743 RepID=UPI0023DA2A78|nr:uncharacterized protein LOC128952188 [Oppia nitens]
MSQSKGVLTTDQQLIYLSQWFAEMSELQTQDFMKCLVNKYSNSGQLTDTALINGFQHFGMSDRPASIFQCRIKLFNEWFAQWSDEEKAELLVRLRNINSTFMDEFQANLDLTHGAGGGGDTDNATDDQHINHQHMNENIDDDSKTANEQLALNGRVDGTDEEITESSISPDSDAKLSSSDDYPSPDNQQEADEEVMDYVVKTATDESVINNNVITESSAEVCG